LILLIDNYDSFVFNVEQYVKELTDEEVRCVRNDKITLDEIKKSANDITNDIQNVVSDTKKTVENIQNPTNLVKDAILNDKKEA